MRETSVKSSMRKLVTAVSDVAMAIVSVPIRKFTQAAQAAVSVMDKPTDISATEQCQVRTGREFCLTEGVDHGLVLGRQPVLKGYDFKVTSDRPARTLAQLASIPAFIERFNMVTTMNPRDMLMSIPTTPKYTPMIAGTKNSVPTTFIPTPAFLAVVPFRYWRGTLIYKVYWTASSFHSARIRISWQPATNTPLYAKEDVLTKVVEINGSGECVFVVPFEHPEAYCEGSTGLLTFWVLNPPAPIGQVTLAPIKFSVYVGMGLDAQFCQTLSSRLCPGYMFSALEELEGKSNGVAEFKEELLHGTPVSVEQPDWSPRDEMHGTVVGPAPDPHIYFGEKFDAIADVLRIQDFLMSTVTRSSYVPGPLPYIGSMYPSIAAIGCYKYRTTANVGIIAGKSAGTAMWDGYHANTLSSGLVVATQAGSKYSVTGLPGYMEHFMSAFKFVRGSVRYNLLPSNPTVFTEYEEVIYDTTRPYSYPAHLTAYMDSGTCGVRINSIDPTTTRYPMVRQHGATDSILGNLNLNPLETLAPDAVLAGSINSFTTPYRSVWPYRFTNNWPEFSVSEYLGPSFQNVYFFDDLGCAERNFTPGAGLPTMPVSKPNDFSVFRTAGDDFVLDCQKAINPCYMTSIEWGVNDDGGPTIVSPKTPLMHLFDCSIAEFRDRWCTYSVSAPI